MRQTRATPEPWTEQAVNETCRRIVQALREADERRAAMAAPGKEGHPARASLLRFLRAETSRTETRAIVLHLLGGCRECSRTTRTLWRMGNRRSPLVGHLETRRKEQGRAARDGKPVETRA